MRKKNLIVEWIPKKGHVYREAVSGEEKCIYCNSDRELFYYDEYSDIYICKCDKSIKALNTQYPINYLFKIKYLVMDNAIRRADRYKNANLSDFLPHQNVVYQSFNIFLNSNKRFLFINGTVGTGKTYCLYAILRDLIYRKIVDINNIYITSEVDLFSKLKGYFGKPEYQYELEKINECAYILWDDFGSAVKSVESEWGRQIIFDIVDMVYSSEKKMILTSNLSNEKILQRLGDRIHDRLYDSIEVDCSCESLRTTEKYNK